MSKISSYLLIGILVNIASMLSCSGISTDPPAPAPVNVYQVVTVSDLHFDPLYDTSLLPDLLSTNPSDWDNVYAKSTKNVPAGGGTDTNYALLMLALASIRQNMGASPVVLFTGDLLGHNIPQTFYTIYFGTKNYPAPPNAATTKLNQFIDHTFSFVAAEIRAAAGKVPVIYVPGNIDTYVGGYGPDSTFLAANEPTVYKQLLNSGVDEAKFLSTFNLDGYYSVQPLGSKLLVIGLNSNSFVANVPSSGDAPAELSWLDSQLTSAQAAGQKVWILMHVPPGANSQGIAQLAATPGEVNDKDASMMWDSAVQSTFMQTLGKYPGLVTLMLAGHTHMDEFRLLPTGDVLEQLPGISPCFGNNPAYKVLTITQDTFTPTDYQSFDYNLAAMPDAFGSLYQFSSTYAGLPTLSSSLQELYPQLIGNQSKRQMYTLLYGSGSAAVNPLTLSPFNPINNVNWPIFACTISQMDESNYVNCVRTY